MAAAVVEAMSRLTALTHLHDTYILFTVTSHKSQVRSRPMHLDDNSSGVLTDPMQTVETNIHLWMVGVGRKPRAWRSY